MSNFIVVLIFVSSFSLFGSTGTLDFQQIDNVVVYQIDDLVNLQERFNKKKDDHKDKKIVIGIADQYKNNDVFILNVISSLEHLREINPEILLLAKRWVKYRDIFVVNESCNQIVSELYQKRLSFSLKSVVEKVYEKSMAMNSDLESFKILCFFNKETYFQAENHFTHLKSELPSTMRFVGMQAKLFLCGLTVICLVAVGLTVAVIISPIALCFFVFYAKGAGRFAMLKKVRYEMQAMQAMLVGGQGAQNLFTSQKNQDSLDLD